MRLGRDWAVLGGVGQGWGRCGGAVSELCVILSIFNLFCCGKCEEMYLFLLSCVHVCAFLCLFFYVCDYR